jgi:photosystem II stability/assembly factor-like uncharacterized protein
MRKAALLASAVLAATASLSCAPEYWWAEQSSGTTAEFRGLSAAGPKVVWAAGRYGTYARSVDGGETWTTGTVAGALDLFFIDVHAVDADTAYLLGTHFERGLAKIYKTRDGGATWIEQYRDSTPGVFFDGMAFWDAESGIGFSDPVADGFLIITTEDGGATWSRVPPQSVPPPLPGEAGFAASGTAIATYGDSSVWIGTGGGHVGRVYRSTDRGRTWSVSETPIAANSTSGIFGLTFWDADNGVAVGGDHTRPSDALDNVARTRDGGRTWTPAGRSQPPGVRWGVTHISGEGGPIIVATGPSGWGYSADVGATWQVGDTVGFNTVTPAPVDATLWLAGAQGRVARLRFPHR